MELTFPFVLPGGESGGCRTLANSQPRQRSQNSYFHAMPLYHVGQRVSFGHALCTVRYTGTVAGTSGEWLGVEWDDPTRGKHDGEHQGVRYFSCLSGSSTAASFVRPTRAADPGQSFVEAVRQKYATEVTSQPLTVALDQQITISGKIAEEVGFDKIRLQQGQLHELKIVIVDGHRISSAATEGKCIRDVCPKISELDLSRNLFDNCKEIIRICQELVNLKSLRLNGNRLQVVLEDLGLARQAFDGIKELELDEMLLPWHQVFLLVQQFDSLANLQASSNCFRNLPSSLPTSTLRSLTLEYNNFESLSDLALLSNLASLETLHLKGNKISTISADGKMPVFGSGLHFLDLSYNAIVSWAFIDDLVDVFPGLTALRCSHNPLYNVMAKQGSSAITSEDVFMLTLARLGRLNVLNFSAISAAERTNAEMFYLSRIGKAMSEAPENEEDNVTSQHRRYRELCEIYGEPIVVRKKAETIDPDYLEARLISFTFYIPPDPEKPDEQAVVKEQKIPKGFDVYRVKGIVGRMFELKPLSLRLMWETGEWDPVAGYEEEGEGSDDDDAEEAKEKKMIDAETAARSERGKWMRREVELEDSTRQVGMFVDGTEAKVRVEMR